MDNKSDKLWKKTVHDQQKRIKPGECQKYVRLILDSHAISATYGKNLICELNSTARDFKYEIKTLPMKETIIWERSMGQLTLERNKIDAFGATWQKEKQVIKLLTQSDLLTMIKTETLYKIGDNFNTHFPGHQHIVLYLRNHEKLSSDITSALIELQVMQQIRVLETESSSKEIINQLKRLTKAVAEVPFKKQKSEILSTFKKFLANDKKQCVRVQGKSGFGRLWQQHLNRLPLVTLEVAETIIDRYPCPKKLNDDFKSNSEAVREVADLKIKRSGPVALQTDRRIGNVLSSKLYMLYNSRDPTTLI